jgi:hypothetical protein
MLFCSYCGRAVALHLGTLICEWFRGYHLLKPAFAGTSGTQPDGELFRVTLLACILATIEFI